MLVGILCLIGFAVFILAVDSKRREKFLNWIKSFKKD